MNISKSKIISLTIFVGIIFSGCGEKVTHKNLDYKVITSPITGKKWLDRNLGATKACESSTDKACYGDYYQWGRLADGHEKVGSLLTTSRVKDVSDVGNKFVVGYKDWTLVDDKGNIRITQWSKIDGTGICPVGFRVPTQTELKAETIEYLGSDNKSTGAIRVIDSETAFQNFLKLPVAGMKEAYDGSFALEGKVGTFWTSSVNDFMTQFFMAIGNAGTGIKDMDRAMGLSVRCIASNSSNTTDTTSPEITSSSVTSVLENQSLSFDVEANDDSAISYSLVGKDSSFFNIDSKTGEITSKGLFDYERKNTYSLTVKATDSLNNFSTQSITINVLDDQNEIPPKYFKTGQTTSYVIGDDGYYGVGLSRSFTRDNTKEIVTDNITKLQWQDDATAKTTKTTGDIATSTCQNLTLGGYNDWKLPTIEELESIVNYGAFNPAKYSEFLNIASYNYWSSTSVSNNSNYAWVVIFNIGYNYTNDKGFSNYVRCVRAGQ